MKKIIIGLVVISVVFAVCLTGCGTASSLQEKPIALAILLGNHANSQGLNLNSKEVQNIVEKAVSSNGYISVITVDGSPEIVFAGSYEIPEQYRNASPEKLKSDAKGKTLSVLSSLSDVKANDPESDVLEAMRLGIRSLSGLGEEYQKYMLILDTGLSTTGLLNFQNNIIEASPELVADELGKINAIPDLTEFTVIWQHMGDVASPQSAMSPNQAEQLSNIWAQVIEKAGGKLEISDEPYNLLTSDESYPEVSIVSLPEELPIQFNPVAFSPSNVTYLSEEQCRFYPDSDVYIDPKEF